MKASTFHFHCICKTARTGRISNDLLNAQRQERHPCSFLTSGFSMNGLHSQKCAGVPQTGSTDFLSSIWACWSVREACGSREMLCVFSCSCRCEWTDLPQTLVESRTVRQITDPDPWEELVQWRPWWTDTLTHKTETHEGGIHEKHTMSRNHSIVSPVNCSHGSHDRRSNEASWQSKTHLNLCSSCHVSSSSSSVLVILVIPYWQKW